MHLNKVAQNDQMFQSATETAYKIMTRKILDGEFKAGDRLPHRRMAQITGTSTIPVITALKQLEEDNLVEAKPQWGAFVTIPTLERVKKSYQFREAIECQSARILSQQMTLSQKESLFLLANELDTTKYDESARDLMRDRHFEFHKKLTEYTENTFLIDALRKINLFWILCRALRESRPRAATPRYWHRKLVDSIASGDPNEAEQCMRDHIMDSYKPIIENWQGD